MAKPFSQSGLVQFADGEHEKSLTLSEEDRTFIDELGKDLEQHQRNFWKDGYTIFSPPGKDVSEHKYLWLIERFLTLNGLNVGNYTMRTRLGCCWVRLEETYWLQTKALALREALPFSKHKK